MGRKQAHGKRRTGEKRGRKVTDDDFPYLAYVDKKRNTQRSWSTRADYALVFFVAHKICETGADFVLYEKKKEAGAWVNIGEYVTDAGGNRGQSKKEGKHCRERFLNNLSPILSSENWSALENRVILEYKFFSKSSASPWSDLRKIFGNTRCGNEIKNHYNLRLKKLLEINKQWAGKVNGEKGIPSKLKVNECIPLLAYGKDYRKKKHTLYVVHHSNSKEGKKNKKRMVEFMVDLRNDRKGYYRRDLKDPVTIFPRKSACEMDLDEEEEVYGPKKWDVRNYKTYSEMNESHSLKLVRWAKEIMKRHHEVLLTDPRKPLEWFKRVYRKKIPKFDLVPHKGPFDQRFYNMVKKNAIFPVEGDGSGDSTNLVPAPGNHPSGGRKGSSRGSSGNRGWGHQKKKKKASNPTRRRGRRRTKRRNQEMDDDYQEETEEEEEEEEEDYDDDAEEEEVFNSGNRSRGYSSFAVPPKTRSQRKHVSRNVDVNNNKCSSNPATEPQRPRPIEKMNEIHFQPNLYQHHQQKNVSTSPEKPLFRRRPNDPIIFGDFRTREETPSQAQNYAPEFCFPQFPKFGHQQQQQRREDGTWGNIGFRSSKSGFGQYGNNERNTNLENMNRYNNFYHNGFPKNQQHQIRRMKPQSRLIQKQPKRTVIKPEPNQQKRMVNQQNGYYISDYYVSKKMTTQQSVVKLEPPKNFPVFLPPRIPNLPAKKNSQAKKGREGPRMSIPATPDPRTPPTNIFLPPPPPPTQMEKKSTSRTVGYGYKVHSQKEGTNMLYPCSPDYESQNGFVIYQEEEVQFEKNIVIGEKKETSLFGEEEQYDVIDCGRNFSDFFLQSMNHENQKAGSIFENGFSYKPLDQKYNNLVNDDTDDGTFHRFEQHDIYGTTPNDEGGEMYVYPSSYYLEDRY